MDDNQFYRWAQGLSARLSRRGLTGLAAGALATLGFADADARKKKRRKKRKKRKKNKGNSAPLPPEVNASCQSFANPCGNTAECICLLDVDLRQICQNQVVPPDGRDFKNRPCQQNSTCGPGQICSGEARHCMSVCAT